MAIFLFLFFFLGGGGMLKIPSNVTGSLGEWARGGGEEGGNQKSFHKNHHCF